MPQRRHEYAARRRLFRRAQQDAPARDHGAAAPLPRVRICGGCHREALHRRRLGSLAAARAGGREGWDAHRLARDRADADRADLATSRSGSRESGARLTEVMEKIEWAVGSAEIPEGW